MLAVMVLGGALDIWSWQVRARRQRAESDEITRYLDHPVGRIIPRFELQFRRSEMGDLRVGGRSNLPDGTTLEAQIYAGGVLVAVDYPVTVSQGFFATRPLLQRGKPFALASYQARIRATFGERWQPPTVLRVVGRFGERLEGPFVRRSDAAPGAKLEFTQDFVLNQ